MPSRVETSPSAATAAVDVGAFRRRFVNVAAFSWGLSAYFPIGVMYLNAVLMLVAMAIIPDLKLALTRLSRHRVVLPLALFVGWTLFVALVGHWFPDTGTRLFHTVRVGLVLCLGMMLSSAQARVAFAGFLVGSCVAAMIVAVHHAWGMPDWALWSSLLSSRNNFSSGNMITMAAACGACLVVSMGNSVERDARRLLLALALILGTTVALHASSRNSQLLLAVLGLVALLHRFRSVKAAMAALTLIGLLVVTIWHFSPITSQRFGEMAEDVHAASVDQNYSTSVGVRWRMYQEAVQGMVAQPLLGTGLGSWLPRWRVVWQQLGPTQPPELQKGFAEINNPHNDFLLAGMETGVPGMLLLAWLMAEFVRTGWRSDSPLGGVAVILGVTLVGTAMVNAPLRDAAMGMTLFWLLGASLALHEGPARA